MAAGGLASGRVVADEDLLTLQPSRDGGLVAEERCTRVVFRLENPGTTKSSAQRRMSAATSSVTQSRI